MSSMDAVAPTKFMIWSNAHVGKIPRAAKAMLANHGNMSTGSSYLMAVMILSLTHSESNSGSKGNGVFTPSNILVLMKKGHTQVVFTLDLSYFSSNLRLSSTPNTANLEPQ